MYEFSPKRTNKAAQYTSILLLIVAFIAMFFSTLPGLAYRSVMQILALIMMSVSLMLMGRYVFRSYVYSIVINSDGKADFTVIEVKRKSRITVCRISLSGIEQVMLTEHKQKNVLKPHKKGRKMFNYCVDLCPDKFCSILCNECGESLMINISYDSRLFEILSQKNGD